jgi:hypothetical protein
LARDRQEFFVRGLFYSHSARGNSLKRPQPLTKTRPGIFTVEEAGFSGAGNGVSRSSTMIDFSSMEVGDRVKMPAVKWGGENRQAYEQAAQYARTVEDEIKPQFQVSGNDDGNGYWLERIR